MSENVKTEENVAPVVKTEEGAEEQKETTEPIEKVEEVVKEEEPIKEETEPVLKVDFKEEEKEEEPQIIEEEEITEVEEVEYADKDEELVAKYFASGKNRATTSELMKLGIDMDRVHPNNFRIGRYKFYRQLIISPFIITKIEDFK